MMWYPAGIDFFNADDKWSGHMRVLFLPAPVPSHLFPMVQLAWAFRAAGHEVYVAGPPSTVADVAGAGLTAVPVGTPYDLMGSIAAAGDIVRRETGEGPSPSGDISQMSPESFRRFAELRFSPHVTMAETMAEDLVAFVRAWKPDLVVTDPITMVAPLAAGVAGAPLVHHLWGPQPPTLSQFPGYGRDPATWPADLAGLFERFGVTPRAQHGVATVDPGPASLQPAEVPNRIPARYQPFNGSGSVPQAILAAPEKPRVCLSWVTANTMTDAGPGGHPLRTLIEALSGFDVETVVAVRSGDRDRLGTLPANVRAIVDLPLSFVMPTCSAAVNHGGTGTALTAVYYGVPQLVVPYNPGLGLNAGVLAKSGAAITVAADPVDPAEVTAAIEQLLSGTDHRKAAEDLRAENLALPALDDVVTTIEEMV
ncbi:UDP:flavonoid glycosyltransferase YjiC (YdhE family) [Micromonospora endolithica]|nr:UDP:flavonoid glycosyltransferase YjiC (YdhE family) [Micromonospora endolithica]